MNQKNSFRLSSASYLPLNQNSKHMFAMRHSLIVYAPNALYSFIPKNGCSTLRLSVDSVDDFNWIHSNNATFQSSLSEATLANYTFVVLR
jgi:hypothetical protein